MNKEQFIKSVKIKGKLNYLYRLKAENDPQKRQAIKPDKQDYLKAAGQVLRKMFENKNDEQDKIPMADLNPNLEADYTPYIGLAFNPNSGIKIDRDLYWVYLINPAQKTSYPAVNAYTGSYAEDLVSGNAFNTFNNFKPMTAVLLESGHIFGLDFTIWYDLDLFDEAGQRKQFSFSLPKGFMDSKSKQEHLDCGIYAMKIPLKKRDGKSVQEKTSLGA